MSINGINGTTSVTRITATPADVAAPTAATRSSSAATAGSPNTSDNGVKLDEATNEPLPPRFPWLSRLSQQLEAASNKRQTFSVPILGDNLDKKA